MKIEVYTYICVGIEHVVDYQAVLSCYPSTGVVYYRHEIKKNAWRRVCHGTTGGCYGDGFRSFPHSEPLILV